MPITPEEMLQIAVLMELHLGWPGYDTVDLPALPSGWHWAGKCDENRCWMDLGCFPESGDSPNWITQQDVAERASLINANIGLLEIM